MRLSVLIWDYIQDVDANFRFDYRHQPGKSFESTSMVLEIDIPNPRRFWDNVEPLMTCDEVRPFLLPI